MKKRFLKFSFFPVTIVLLLAIGLNTPSFAGDKVQQLQVPSFMPVGSSNTKAMDLFCKLVNENSKGMLQLQHFPARQLMSDREVPQAILKGTVKIGLTYMVWWSGMIKDVFPYGGKQVHSFDHAMRFYRGPFERHVEQRVAQTNAIVIAPLFSGFKAGYMVTKPVKKLGDMNGMKIRVPTKNLAAEVKALGGVPTVMSSGDVYISMQRNLIQGGITNLTSFVSRKWYEVAKYAFLLRPGPNNFHIVANKQWFENLPSDLQQVIMDAGKTASELNTKMVLEDEEKAYAILQKKGVKIYEVNSEEYYSDFAPVVEPALRKAAVEQFGEQLAAKWDNWVDSTRK